MSTPSQGSIMTSLSSSLIKEVAQRALEQVSVQVGDIDLALMHLTEHFQNLSTTSRSYQTRHLTVRFKIAGVECQNLVRDALATKIPDLFLSAPAPFNRIAAAMVKEGVLWLYLNDHGTCRAIRKNPWKLIHVFRDGAMLPAGDHLSLIPETFLLYLPGFRPDQRPSRDVERALPQNVLVAAGKANRLKGTIKKVSFTCQLWVMYLDTEDDALDLARRGEMVLDNQVHVKVKPFEAKSLFVWCYKCRQPGHMQKECKSKEAWCGQCAQRDHRSTGGQCTNPPRCVNCRDSSGRPMEGHRVWDTCCQFPASVKMRKQALSRRVKDPWWWDADFEKKKREAPVKANTENTETSPQPELAPTVESVSTGPRKRNRRSKANRNTQPANSIDSHSQPVGHHNLEQNREQVSPAPTVESAPTGPRKRKRNRRSKANRNAQPANSIDSHSQPVGHHNLEQDLGQVSPAPTVESAPTGSRKRKRQSRANQDAQPANNVILHSPPVSHRNLEQDLGQVLPAPSGAPNLESDNAQLIQSEEPFPPVTTEKDAASSNDACVPIHVPAADDTEDAQLLSTPNTSSEKSPRTSLSCAEENASPFSDYLWFEDTQLLSTPDESSDKSPRTPLLCTGSGKKANPLSDDLWIEDATQGTQHSKKPPSSNSASTRQTRFDFTSGFAKLVKAPKDPLPGGQPPQSSVTPPGSRARTPTTETSQVHSEAQISREDSPSSREITSPAVKDVIVVKPLPEDFEAKDAGQRRQLTLEDNLNSKKRKATETLLSAPARKKTAHSGTE